MIFTLISKSEKTLDNCSPLCWKSFSYLFHHHGQSLIENQDHTSWWRIISMFSKEYSSSSKTRKIDDIDNENLFFNHYYSELHKIKYFSHIYFIFIYIYLFHIYLFIYCGEWGKLWGKAIYFYFSPNMSIVNKTSWQHFT